MGRICDICNYDLGEQTEFNFERHRNSNQCKANQRKKKVEVCGKSITNYFKLSNNNVLRPSIGMKKNFINKK
jgi:hypothetical protein